MNFGLTSEQEMIIESVKSFVEKELYPFEDEVEKNNKIEDSVVEQIKQKSIESGLYACNMPENYGGGGLDSLTLCLLEKELGKANFGLQYIVARPSDILLACKGSQVDEYLLPTIRGDKVDCLAMTEPNAGSDVRSMKCKAERDGEYFVINGSKHFISHADMADYVILFAASGIEQHQRVRRKR